MLIIIIWTNLLFMKICIKYFQNLKIYINNFNNKAFLNKAWNSDMNKRMCHKNCVMAPIILIRYSQVRGKLNSKIQFQVIAVIRINCHQGKLFRTQFLAIWLIHDNNNKLNKRKK